MTHKFFFDKDYTLNSYIRLTLITNHYLANVKKGLTLHLTTGEIRAAAAKWSSLFAICLYSVN